MAKGPSGQVHVISSRYGGAILATVPATAIEGHAGYANEDHHEHSRWLAHLDDQGISLSDLQVHTLPADDVPQLAHGHVIREGSIGMQHEVPGVASALHVVEEQRRLIERLEGMLNKSVGRIEELNARLAAATAPKANQGGA